MDLPPNPLSAMACSVRRTGALFQPPPRTTRLLPEAVPTTDRHHRPRANTVQDPAQAADVQARAQGIDRENPDTTIQMSTDITTRLGQELRKVRKAAGLTQEQAAELAGVTKSRWSQMESGKVSNLNKLQVACEAIGAVLTVGVSVPREG